MNLRKILISLIDLPKIAAGKGFVRYYVGKQKSLLSRFFDLIIWFLGQKEVLRYYYALGFEIKTRAQIKEYISQYRFLQLENKINKQLSFSKVNQEISFWTGESHFTSTVLVGDKFVSAAFMKGLGLPCVESLILIADGVVTGFCENIGTVDDVYRYLIKRDHPVFLKMLDGFGGEGVYKLECKNEKISLAGQEIHMDDLLCIIHKGRWIIQNSMEQHHELARVYSMATNCLRVNTVLRKHVPEFLAAFMKFGCGENTVDNWDKGGVLVGIKDEFGHLQAHGYYNPKTSLKGTCMQHPDSKDLFDGFTVPFYREAVELCLRAHRYFYSRVIIGWDIVISETGPVILEANSNPSVTALQMLFGSMGDAINGSFNSNVYG